MSELVAGVISYIGERQLPDQLSDRLPVAVSELYLVDRNVKTAVDSMQQQVRAFDILWISLLLYIGNRD